MANNEQIEVLRQGVDVWNKWRGGNPEIEIDLSNSIFTGKDLFKANFNGANLSKANFDRANLFGADFSGTNLRPYP